MKIAKQYMMYLIRWQLSTPILAVVLIVMGKFGIGATIATIVANFIGGLIFYWIDKFIFRKKILVPWWEVRENIVCSQCGKPAARGYRLVKSKNYDAESKKPVFLCETCSMQKSKQLHEKGFEV